jgi:hypothetical protein
MSRRRDGTWRTEASAMRFELMIHAGPLVPADRLDAIARELRAELEESGFVGELPPGGPVPLGAKGSPINRVGMLLISTPPTSFPKLVNFLQSWLSRSSRRAITLRSSDGRQTLQLRAEPQAPARPKTLQQAPK